MFWHNTLNLPQNKKNAPRLSTSKNFFVGKAKSSSSPGEKSGLPVTTASRCAAASGSIMPRTRAAVPSASFKNITAKAMWKPCPCCLASAWSRFIRRQKSRSRWNRSPSRRPFRTRTCTACSRICSKRAGWMRRSFHTLRVGK